MLLIEVVPTPTVMLQRIFDVREDIDSFLALVHDGSSPDFRTCLRVRASSVPETVVLTFIIECSRAVSHELVRHRVATYIQESQRFRVQRPKFILPRSMISEETVRLLEEIYIEYLKLLEKSRLPSYLPPRLVAEVAKHEDGYPPEFARYILPNASATLIYVQWNLREICEVVIPLRMCTRAQPEFMYIAYKIFRIVTEKFPEVLEEKYTGPRCLVYGRCLYGVKNPEKCFRNGLHRALKEHGTDDELRNIDNIVNEVFSSLFK